MSRLSLVCSWRFPLNTDGKNYILGGTIMNFIRRRLSFMMLFVVILLLVFVSFSSLAEEYPKEKTIRFLVGTSPGGGTSIISRILASSAQPLIDQRIDTVCMPGASGQEAIHFVMNQPQDGYTFLISDLGCLVAPALREDLGYDLSDWKPVMQISEFMTVFYVRADSPIKDLNDWVAKAKAEPNVFAFAHGTHLCPPHISLLMFEKTAGIQNKKLTTTGGGENLAFILGGHVDLSVSLPTTVGPLVEAGQLRALAVTGENRDSFLPDTPTLKELGYDIVFGSWFMVLAYKDVPEDRIEFMQNKFIEAMNTPGAKKLANKLKVGLVLYGSQKSQEVYNTTIEDLTSLFADIF